LRRDICNIPNGFPIFKWVTYGRPMQRSGC
jgi:hypothetical protein